MNSLVFN